MARITDKPKAPDTPRLGLGLSQPLTRAPSAKQPLNFKVENEYPWDSHQDDIVVNSTELNQHSRKLGVEHYRHQLTLRKTYEHITTDFVEDQHKILPKDALPVPFSSSSDGDKNAISYGNGDGNDDNWDSKTRHRYYTERNKHISSYTTLAKPNFTRLTYSDCIYRASTSNPAVFLAIIRVAEQNLPFINFDSAITHLPNRAANACLPSLPRSSNNAVDQKRKAKGQVVFTEDMPYEENKGDEVLTVLFLPSFYKDGRHAVGYYGLSPAYDKDEGKRLGMEHVVQILFTPCEIGDLERWGLLLWNHGAAHLDEARRLEEAAIKADGGEGKGGEDQEPDTEYMEFVGARGGKWLESDTVEDYNEWSEGFRVVSRIWEEMIKAVVSGVEQGEAQS